MLAIRQALAALTVAIAIVATAGTASAQATRTWISGVGDDVNPCSRTAPCKTFAGAISKTANGGEIDILDPGGFGALTITKSITIAADNNGEAGILVSGTNGFTVNGSAAPSPIHVIIRGIFFNGINYSGGPGINGVNIVNAGEVTIDDCRIIDFGNAGVLVQPQAGTSVQVTVRNSTISGNKIGVQVDGTIAGSGQTVNATVVGSTLSDNNSNGIQVQAPTAGGGATATAVVSDTAAVNGGTAARGFHADGIGATLYLSRDLATGNGTGVALTHGAVINTFGNNIVQGNGTNVSGTLTTVTNN